MAKLLSYVFIAGAILSVCSSSTSKAADVTAGRGNELVQYCNYSKYQAKSVLWNYCVGYVSGVDNGFNLLINVINEKNTYYCTPDDVTRQQMALVVSKYLIEHPESLNIHSQYLILAAFTAAWPCPKTGK